ncbi:MAG: Xaa-Pro aminopeptidase [SAR86 cluster bacterium]|uniref:Xaa-Pro aminopeptidase n=1 Tax=SAR86 cluster bacterium TaxID=2030880 RepID=A0A2A4X4Z8_9GAMM|nr:MAG: Xaa-Pro aminopeptidase [SAR86 cluster bacterium]
MNYSANIGAICTSALLLLGLSSGNLFADELGEKVLTLRERAVVENQILEERLDYLVPQLMRREGIDAWVLIAREYNEDPVLKTMLPATWLNARRRTVLMFLDHGDSRGVERLAIARYAVGELFPGTWNPEEQPDQYQRIAQLLTEFNPSKIALNFSDTYALADGLTYSEQRDFSSALPSDLQNRIMSAENLAVGWLETRTASEMEVYKDVMAIAHEIIAEGFTSAVVEPGKTTIEDLTWWYRQRLNDLGLDTWFHTGIELMRSDASQAAIGEDPDSKNVFHKGDLIHIDFGISYLNLQTDTQQNAYILKDDEATVPGYLVKALQKGNELQDILTNNFQVGRTGNEILHRTREQAISAGIEPIIYTHPIGLHGHAAGTTIGMWDKQGGVPGSGDYPMNANTAYSIELTALVDVPEWSSAPLSVKLEEDGFYDGSKFAYIQPRQTEYHIIQAD